MRIEVRYMSRGGNTKRLADAVASALGVEATAVTEPMAEKADTVFLCASVYAGGPDKAVTEYIRRNAQSIGRIVVLSTSASGKSTQGRIRAVAGDAGIPVSDAFFHCPGAWTLFHKGRPNADDCRRAAEFARAQLQ
ncbi:MAG: flavodoxin [Clostridia bacterium]|nr:flavodoxin [Clostridia bacterium]